MKKNQLILAVGGGVSAVLVLGSAALAFPREEIEICREKLFLEAGTPALPGLYIESVPKADEKA